MGHAHLPTSTPGFRLAEAYPTAHVTIGDLFAHRSGLSGNAGNDLEALGFGRDEILRRLRYLKPASSFRSTYAYSNFGLTQGAVAAAKAAGLSWEDAAEAKLYRRLGMASTSSRHSDFLARNNRASLHVRIDGRWTALARRDPDGQSPAGGASSTARDRRSGCAWSSPTASIRATPRSRRTRSAGRTFRSWNAALTHSPTFLPFTVWAGT